MIQVCPSLQIININKYFHFLFGWVPSLDLAYNLSYAKVEKIQLSSALHFLSIKNLGI